MSRPLRGALIVVVLASILTVAPRPTVVWATVYENVADSPTAEPVADGDSAVEQGLVPLDLHHEHGAVGEADEEHGPVAIPIDVGPVVAFKADDLDPFAMLGVTVDLLPDEPLVARMLEDGVWSDWYPLHFDTGHAPEGEEAERAATGFSSEPLWADAATAYEIQTPDDVAAPRVQLVVEAGTEPQVVTEDLPVAGAADSVTVRSRSAWGAAPAESAASIASDLRMGIIHHVGSDSFNDSYSASQVPGLIRQIQAFHQGTNNWDDIGYNFIVDRFGNIWEGRAGGVTRNVVGAHAMGFNTYTTGVLLLGDYQSGSPSSAAVRSAGTVISWKLGLNATPPSGTFSWRMAIDNGKFDEGQVVTMNRVSGHRDVRTTACPGNAAHSLPTIRDRVRSEFLRFLVDPDLSVPKALYRDFLSRSGAASEHRYWAERILMYGITSVSHGFSLSNEYLSKFIRAFYQSALGRSGANSEIATWRERIQRGRISYTDVVVGVYASPEAWQKSGSNAGAYVDLLYRSLLGRTPASNDSGRRQWVQFVENGGDRASLVRSIYASAESRTRRVHALYRHFLQRSADEQGLRTWTSRLKTADDIELATILTTSAEYRGKADTRFPE